VLANRALCYIKIGKFGKAIEDCTKIIDYYEVFETPVDTLVIKAYLRRSSAFIERKKYNKARKDIFKILDINPNQK